MNDLGLMLLGAALRVTLLALAAVVLYAVVARRGPGAAAPVAATCLGASVVLTLLALCPLPSWWALRATPGDAVVTATPRPSASTPDDIKVSLSTPEDGTPAASHGTGVGLSWSSGFLRRGWELLHQATVSPSSPRWDWPGAAAVIFLTGAIWCLLRLLVGLSAIRQCLRRSRGITDAELLQLAESLRTAMGCARGVEIRACPDLASPATVGWLRPVVLLPADWRGWSDVERRAVLAHELAHVSRSDFLTGLWARVGVALHFYHPLLHWMAGQLHLQQELAADALAVRVLGGRGPYLRTLARLALRQDGRPTAWPVHALFSSHGTLMRRIHMLRTKEGVASPSLPRWGRLLLMGPLVAVAVGVSALRSPAQKSEETPQGGQTPPLERLYAGGFRSLRGFAFRGAGQEFRSEAVPGTQLQRYQVEQEPFDLSSLPPDAMGAVCIRPAAILGRPGMKKYADALNQGLEEFFVKVYKLPTGPGLSATDIEQVTTAIVAKKDPDGRGGPSGSFAYVTMIRTVKDFDWRKLFQTMMPGATEVRHAGKVYYKMPENDFRTNILSSRCGGPGSCYFFPDGRTVVFDDEETVRQVIEKKRGDRTAPVWSEGWKHVERGMFAMLLDNRNGSWRFEFEEREKPASAYKPFYENVAWMVIGGDGSDDHFALRGLAACANEQGSEKVARATEGLLAKVAGRQERVCKALEDEINKAFPDTYVRLFLVRGTMIAAGKVKDAIEATQILSVLRANAPATTSGGAAAIVDLLQFPENQDGKLFRMQLETKLSIDKVFTIILSGELPDLFEEPTPDKKP
jgi:beta-lactamase regulating signal transducer with metallopeptidase domain